MFMFLESILIDLWRLIMMFEYRRMVEILTVCARMPRSEDLGDDVVIMDQDPSGPEEVRLRIQGLEVHHRMTHDRNLPHPLLHDVYPDGIGRVRPGQDERLHQHPHQKRRQGLHRGDL